MQKKEGDKQVHYGGQIVAFFSRDEDIEVRASIEQSVPREPKTIEQSFTITCPDCQVELVSLLKLAGEATDDFIFYQVICPRCKISSYKRSAPLKISLQAIPPFILAGVSQTDNLMKLTLIERK